MIGFDEPAADVEDGLISLRKRQALSNNKRRLACIGLVLLSAAVGLVCGDFLWSLVRQPSHSEALQVKGGGGTFSLFSWKEENSESEEGENGNGREDSAHLAPQSNFDSGDNSLTTPEDTSEPSSTEPSSTASEWIEPSPSPSESDNSIPEKSPPTPSPPPPSHPPPPSPSPPPPSPYPESPPPRPPPPPSPTPFSPSPVNPPEPSSPPPPPEEPTSSPSSPPSPLSPPPTAPPPVAPSPYWPKGSAGCMTKPFAMCAGPAATGSAIDLKSMEKREADNKNKEEKKAMKANEEEKKAYPPPAPALKAEPFTCCPIGTSCVSFSPTYGMCMPWFSGTPPRGSSVHG